MGGVDREKLIANGQTGAVSGRGRVGIGGTGGRGLPGQIRRVLGGMDWGPSGGCGGRMREEGGYLRNARPRSKGRANGIRGKTKGPGQLRSWPLDPNRP